MARGVHYQSSRPHGCVVDYRLRYAPFFFHRPSHTYLTAPERPTAEFREEAEQRRDPDYNLNHTIMQEDTRSLVIMTIYPHISLFPSDTHPSMRPLITLAFLLLTLPKISCPSLSSPLMASGHKSKDVVSEVHHFTGIISLSRPLATVAAKLPRLSRREVHNPGAPTPIVDASPP